MTFYQKYLDCGRDFSDFYVNTPRVSEERNNSPVYIHIRWGADLDPNDAIVEFHNYYSTVPHQHAKTITSRSTFGIYPRTTPDLQLKIQNTMAVPIHSQRFRIRFQKNGNLVTNFVPIRNNAMYYYENGHIFEYY